MGVSPDTFYRYQELANEGGVEVLIDKSRRSPYLKNRVDTTIEDAVKTYAIDYPVHGQLICLVLKPSLIQLISSEKFHRKSGSE